MAKKEPLYPHVPKRRKKGTNAWRCKQCGWTTWNVIYCPKCGSRDLEELTTEEVTSFYETGEPVIHPRTELPEKPTLYRDIEGKRHKLVGVEKSETTAEVWAANMRYHSGEKIVVVPVVEGFALYREE